MLLAKHVEKIGLILVGISSLLEKVYLVITIILDASIVSCCNILDSEFVSLLEEFTELEPLVTEYAWIRGFALKIGFAEGFDNQVLKCIAQIDYVVRYTKMVSNAPSILNTGNTCLLYTSPSPRD